MSKKNTLDQLQKQMILLKAQAYDTLAKIEQLQSQMQQINSEILLTGEEITKESQLLVEEKYTG